MFCSLIMCCPQKGFRDSVGEAQRQSVAFGPIFPHSLRYYLEEVDCVLGAVKKETFRSGESETRTSKLKRIRTC